MDAVSRWRSAERRIWNHEADRPQLKRGSLGSGSFGIRMHGSFFSTNELHWVAEGAVKAAPTGGLQSLVAIMFSCAFVEAAINELLHQIAEAEAGGLGSLRPIARAAGLYGKNRLHFSQT